MYNITRSKLIRAASVDMGDIYEHGRQQFTTTNNTIYRTDITVNDIEKFPCSEYPI